MKNTSSYNKGPPSSWLSIDYTDEPGEQFLLPPENWSAFNWSLFEKNTQVKLNHLTVFFLCEMFVFFEKALIFYMNSHQTKILEFITLKQMNRFIREEQDHIDAFQKIAKRIIPDKYRSENNYIQLIRKDYWVIQKAPMLPFFFMTSIFEETTISVFDFMKSDVENCWQPLLEVMHLHAYEERSHVGLDFKIIDGLNKKNRRLRSWFEMQSLLPLLVYCLKRVQFSWKKAALEFSCSEKLSRRETYAILDRGITITDLMGFKAFIQKYKNRKITGAGPLIFILKYILKKQTSIPQK